MAGFACAVWFNFWLGGIIVAASVFWIFRSRRSDGIGKVKSQRDIPIDFGNDDRWDE